MPILNIQIGQTGLVGVLPRLVYIETNDPEATVLTAGYLNKAVQEGFSFQPTDIAAVITQESPGVASKSGWYQITHVSTNWSLAPVSSSGDVVLPTIANHIATYIDTTGTLSEDASTAINNGNIQAGMSGSFGEFIAYPTTANKGRLIFGAANNTGNTDTTVTNAPMGQASVVAIPDPANATARFLVGATNAPFVNGNFPVNSGTGGLMVDSGIAASNLATTSTAVLLNPAADQNIIAHNLSVSQGSITAGSSGHAGRFASFPTTAANGELILAAVDAGGAFNTTISNGTMGQSTVYTLPDPVSATANFAIAPTALVSGNFVKASGTAGLVVDGGAAIHAGTTAAYAGGGTSNAFVATGMAASWIVSASILSQTGTASIVKVVPSANTLTVTFSADPGANTVINWIALTAAI